MSGGEGRLHFAVTWHRPRFQGGDVLQPLCRAPAIGVCAPVVRRWPLTLHAAAVECPACRNELAAGGLKARHARLIAVLAADEGARRAA